MISHTLVLFFRNVRKHKTTFLINLLGLSSGLVCVLLIAFWVKDELDVDNFLENNERLFQVMLTFEDNSGLDTTSWSPAPLGKALYEEIPDIEQYVTAYTPPNFGAIAKSDGALIRPQPLYASSEFFNVFSFELIKGDKGSVLQNIKSAVISDELAYKLFGTSNEVVGKVLEYKDEKLGDIFLITGVFRSPRANSTLQFDIVFPFEYFIERAPEFNSWVYNDPNTYVLIKKESSISKVNEKVTGLLKSKPKTEVVSTYLQQYSERYLHGTFQNGKPSGGRIFYLWLFSSIAILILLVACINFINLSTAQASRRIKEIGVKKVFGVHRRALVFQHFCESLATTLISASLAILIVITFISKFNMLLNKQIVLDFDFPMISMLALVTLLTSLISGIYPAVYLSNKDSMLLLKGRFKKKSKDLWIQKGLVIFQFSVSILLIVSILIISKQINYIQNKNLGLNKEHVIIIKRDEGMTKKLETFLMEVKNIPGVQSASSSYHELLINGTSTEGLLWQGKDPNSRLAFKYILANYNFLEVLDIKIKEGRSFSRSFKTDAESAVILNETAIKRMGIPDAVGKTITIWGEDRQIVGVVKDFNFQSLYEPMHPLFMIISDSGSDILIRIRGENQASTISKLQNLYRDFNGGLNPDFHFLDRDYNSFYESEMQIATLSKYFGILAILITCMGLFGLAFFTAEQRRKEIGIRKVMGQSATEITIMLSGEFVKLVIAAFLLISPVTYVLLNNWVSGFSYHVSIRPWYFIAGGFIAFVVSIITVSSQAVNAANKNPAEVLRE